MKLSKDTIGILQSLCNINTSIVVEEGNTLTTRNAVRSVMVKAEIAEDFPKSFAIYDLTQFLGLLNTTTSPEIEFNDKSLTISSADQTTIEFFYADKTLIDAPPKDLPTVKKMFTFEVTRDDINKINKVASLISATHISVKNKNGEAVLEAGNPSLSTGNNFNKILADTSLSFDMKLSIDNFKVVPDDYEVSLCEAVGKSNNKVLVFLFSSTTKNLQYLMAAEINSRIS